jgi:hypothetical protein
MDFLYAYFNRFELKLFPQAVEDCYHQGDCLSDVQFWLDKIREINQIDDVKIKEELKEYGAWDDEELNDINKNWEKIIWLGAGNIQEDNN